MASVSGHVYVKPRKKGDVWYMKFRDQSGRQVEKALGPDWKDRSRPPAGHYTKKLAQEALEAKLTDLRRGIYPDARETGRTFREACDEFERYVRVEKDAKASTLIGYRSVNRVLLTDLGEDTPLERLTTERLDDYRARLLSEGELSARSIQKRLVQLYGILKRAKRLKWIASNPAEDVERVRVRRSGDFNVLTPTQVEAVARVALAQGDGYAALVRVAAYTGLRLGELRALRWIDVDFASQTVFVRLNRTQGGLGTPKSDRIRSVPLIDEAAVALDALSRRPMFTGPEDLVFGSALGTARDEGEIRDAFYGALEDAKLGHLREKEDDPIVFHDLRHTFGTLAVQAWPLTDVQAYMGHADIQTTMKYVHHIPKTAAAAQLGDVVKRALGENVSPNVSRTAENGAQLSEPNPHKKRDPNRERRLRSNS